MTNLTSKDMEVKEVSGSTNKQKSFLNAFAAIATKAMNEYHNNTHEQELKIVKIPNQIKEDPQ